MGMKNMLPEEIENTSFSIKNKDGFRKSQTQIGQCPLRVVEKTLVIEQSSLKLICFAAQHF